MLFGEFLTSSGRWVLRHREILLVVFTRVGHIERSFDGHGPVKWIQRLSDDSGAEAGQDERRRSGYAGVGRHQIVHRGRAVDARRWSDGYTFGVARVTSTQLRELSRVVVLVVRLVRAVFLVEPFDDPLVRRRRRQVPRISKISSLRCLPYFK